MRSRFKRRVSVGSTLAAAIAAVIAASIVAAPTQVAAQPSDTDAATQELAERYAPIVMLKDQAEECDTYGEPFAPMSVDAVLDNEQIALRQVGNGDPLMMRAPTASDLFELGGGFYLDFPGDALQPGCLFERDFRRYAERYPPTVYAHVVQQADHPDLIAVQYWLFWYYNDWNNKHEGDWEFVQVLLPASSVEEALTVEPIAVGYAQHTGGERADWDSEKLEREGSRPVVYSSARSHASYFGQALFMGRSASEGFGCDNTDGPSTRVDPEVVVLPDEVTDPADPLGWLMFDGRWGERQAGVNNGPTGPYDKGRWSAPVDWHEGLRDSSFVVPIGDSFASELTGAFCGVVEWGAVKFIEFQSSPMRMLISLAVILSLAVFIVRRTSWSSVAGLPVVHPRRAGEIVRSAFAHYRRRPLTFGAIGLVYIPLAALAGMIGALISSLPRIGDFVSAPDAGGASRLLMSLLITGLSSAIAFFLADAAVARVLDRASAGEPTSARDAFGTVVARRRDLGSALGRAVAVIVVLYLTVIGIPWAIHRLIRYQFAAQAVMLEGMDGTRALHRSSDLVRGRWWHTALFVAGVAVVLGGFGMVVGLLMLVLFTGLPLWSLAVIMTLTTVLVMPLGAIAVTLLYGDAAATQPDRTPNGINSVEAGVGR